MIYDEMSEKIIETAQSLVMENGSDNLNVRMILRKMNITNRVFYNRFHNMNEVLAIVYKNITATLRQSLEEELDPKKDFFEQVMDMIEKSLLMSYDNKMQFNYYIFENDSQSDSNYGWWTGKIKKLIEYAKSNKLIKDVDSEALSYSIWCFCRGYNADAVGRKLPKEEAVAKFRYSFNVLLEGLKI